MHLLSLLPLLVKFLLVLFFFSFQLHCLLLQLSYLLSCFLLLQSFFVQSLLCFGIQLLLQADLFLLGFDFELDCFHLQFTLLDLAG
jgi:hypothetical protein